ncbi:MAG: hypothetical protein Q7S27_04960 [Nanoarchaeota archaeon]|nr:hypothetical protein [Nanoarchaeota archaeon]
MGEEKYSSKIEFGDDCLDIKISYDARFTREDYNQALNYFEWRASKQNNTVDRDQIEVSPKEGEIRKVETALRVKLNDDLLAERAKILIKAPYVIPLLVQDLVHYRESNELLEEEERLIGYAITQLEKTLEK